jgi:cation:H+ antiporter
LVSAWYFAEDLRTWALLAEIAAAAAIVIVAGAKLTTLADRVADRYNLGGAWIGTLLLATVTSLPEVVTGTTSVWLGQPGMAFATIFGSCSFNIVLIVLLNAFIGGGSILQGRGRGHTLTSSFGIVLICLPLMGMVLVSRFSNSPTTEQVTEIVVVLLIAVTYFVCMRMVYTTDKETLSVEIAHDDTEALNSPDVHQYPYLLTKVAALSFVLASSAWWLTGTGDILSEHPIEAIGRPLGATFVGFLFLAFATSLPEVVTGLSAVRIGNLDMALGNIFGSNMFNILVIPALKLTSLSSGERLLFSGDNLDLDQLLIAGLLPILLTGVVVGGLSYRTSRTIFKRFGFDSALLAVVYVAGTVLILCGD